MKDWVLVYLFSVALVLFLKCAFVAEPSVRVGEPSVKKEEPMAAPIWRMSRTIDVPAKPDGLWTLVLDHVDPSTKLRIQASGIWTYSTQLTTPATPDGDPASPLDRTKSLLPEALIGTLVGKVGGSTAGIKDDGHVFVVGRSCVVKLDEKTEGPLYLTINDEISGYADNDGRITVTIEQEEK
jgi:hypothetical protein